ncbi:hypothetical protein CYLTODRAFT_62392 [Cylindrobasidium torrendii FP15055 ss-10]|uniref:Uncharacterized protein n=1 Tax=Cylindrobasidium torrendii FP15055 ss-10 TaxID=1314674 RepID=A0A0D7BR98_9AGAR|nr:hypothetical protein CYLTODRAFT_62392 [Cylindrobasidium torrendii FP15055 ss-10]
MQQIHCKTGPPLFPQRPHRHRRALQDHHQAYPRAVGQDQPARRQHQRPMRRGRPTAAQQHLRRSWTRVLQLVQQPKQHRVPADALQDHHAPHRCPMARCPGPQHQHQHPVQGVHASRPAQPAFSWVWRCVVELEQRQEQPRLYSRAVCSYCSAFCSPEERSSQPQRRCQRIRMPSSPVNPISRNARILWTSLGLGMTCELDLFLLGTCGTLQPKSCTLLKSVKLAGSTFCRSIPSAWWFPILTVLEHPSLQ